MNTEEITPEQDEAGLGRLSLWAEVLKCAVEDVSGGIYIGALTADLRATGRQFMGRLREQAASAVDALDFLRSHGAVRLCDMFHTDPEYVLRMCRERELLPGPRSYIKAPLRATARPSLRVPKHQLAGNVVGTWVVLGTTGETNHEGCMWRCRCSGCGAEKSYPTRRLRIGNVGKCLCLSKAAAARRYVEQRGPDKCLRCGGPVQPSRSGSPRFYCSRRCKSAAFYMRKTAAAKEVGHD